MLQLQSRHAESAPKAKVKPNNRSVQILTRILTE